MLPTDKLEQLSRRYRELDELLCRPDVLADRQKISKLNKERSDLEPVIQKFALLQEVSKKIKEDEEARADPELRELAELELPGLEAERTTLEQSIQLLLLPQDPNERKNTILEIRSGEGGEEAALFAADLFRMYSRFAETKGWKVEILNVSESATGGYEECIALVTGKDVYAQLRFEGGVHRVQRVPATEAQGRIHTSTATVAVLPQVEDDVEIEIKPSELQVDTFKASGAGGQYVNKTESAIRITHLPTGIIVASQQERSQQQNREKAMQMLRATLHDRKRREQEEAVGSMRRSQVGSGDRSEKIRTYNFPQDRVTDHRINRNFGNIRSIMDGDLRQIADELIADERARLLAGEHAGS
jgi:peptide chain release factor 1